MKIKRQCERLPRPANAQESGIDLMGNGGSDHADIDLLTWCVSEEKIGTMSQCVGVARNLSRKEPVVKPFVPVHGIRKAFAPALFSRKESRPDIIISCGYRPEKVVLKMKRTFSGEPFTVHLQRPEIEGYDLVFVSNHDWTRELEARPNYERMIGVPHRLRLNEVSKRRRAARSLFSPDDRQLASVFVGGDNGAYIYDQKSVDNIKNAIDSLTSKDWRVLVSTSRRSDRRTFDALMALSSPLVTVWDRREPNPYLDYVAAADAFLIAKDSITMPCEALLTGRPVYSLELTEVPGERLIKFDRFHRDLQETRKLTRRFDGGLESYSYQPINEALRIAEVIRSRVAKHS